jgi:hypothetical protein
MKKQYTLLNLAVALFLTFTSFSQKAEFIYGDPLPDAPALSARGDYKVGVKTLEYTNKNQLDILKSKGTETAFYDRKLKVEVWYPANLGSDEKELVAYDEVMGSSNDPKRPLIPFTFQGRALRDAKPVISEGKFPLVIVSHGYLGSRLLLTYLTENLASKGYIVVAIDHTFFKGTIDSDNAALIGYSMGGYGVLNVAGAGYSDNSLKLFGALTGGSKALESRLGSNAEYKASLDSRIKAVVAFAPWGMERGVWDAESLKGLKIPTFFFAGSQDDISGYEKGIKAIYNGVINTDRYILTYLNARHNVAPNPPPAESLQPGLHIDEYYRYAEPSWNEKRINNINQHFVTAFLGIHLKQKDFGKYLNLPQDSNTKTWEGFKPRSSVGLELLHALPEGK